MKNLKRITALILATLVMVATLPTVSVFANNTNQNDMYYGRKMLSQMPNGQDLIRIYELLVDGCADMEEQIAVPDHISISRAELETVYSMFYSDYPEYFWVGNGTPGYALMGDKITIIAPIYIVANIPDMEQAKADYNEKVAELTSGLNGKSDYEKSKILHDRVCEETEYVYGNNHQSSYGALVEGEAVCNGYARAYQHLLKEVGIPSWYVIGVSYDPVSYVTIAHAWNTVKLDGEWYYTDVTWDDHVYTKNYFLYNYFNITKEQLLVDHIIDSSLVSLVPNATSTAANYFVVEDLIFTSFDIDRIVDALSNEEFMAQMYISGDVQSFAVEFFASELSILLALGIQQVATPVRFILGNTLIVDYDGVTSFCKHKYYNNCDTDCNDCGDVRNIEHEYNGDHICDVCQYKKVNIGNVFPDTAGNAWYSDAVAYVYSQGIMSGYSSSNKFGTSDGIQRQDFLVMLARFDGVDLEQYKGESDFRDVARNSYYEAAVNWGVEKNITTGYNATTFGVGDMITREQIVTFLYRYAKYKGLVVNDVTDTKAKAYPDYNKVSVFSKDAIIWAIDKGVINGKSGYIAPQGNAQRCEIAQIMYNIFLNEIF